MGCGAISRQKETLSAEEQAILKYAEQFRQRIINDVQVQRIAARSKQAKAGFQCKEVDEDDADTADSGLLSSESLRHVKKSSSFESFTRKDSILSKDDPLNRLQYPELLVEHQTSFGMSSAVSSTRSTLHSNEKSTSSALAFGARFSGNKSTVVGNRPLKNSCHKTRNSLCEQELLGTNSLRVTVPGKVGSRDEQVDVDDHLIMKTRKVHKHKDYAKKVYARRRLPVGSLEQVDAEDEDPAHNKLPQEEKKALMKSVQRHFLFSSLSKAEQQMLLDQMHYQENQEGEMICEKGQKGEACYMIISGICRAEKDGISVAQFSAGDLFGELAMLYDVPRTASVVCVSPRVVLGVIRGHTFRKSLALGKERTLSSTLDFLNHHKVFSKLALEEKRMLANTLNFETFEPGALLIDDSHSNTCEWMFLVQDGSVEVHDEYKNHKVLGAGATISGSNMPYGNHAVLAKALSHVKAYSIGYAVMNRLFGNITEVLRISTIRAFLEPLSLFKQLTDKQQSLVAGCFQEQKVSKGDIIVSALADPQLILVMEGDVSVIDVDCNVATSPSGRIEILKQIKQSADAVCADMANRSKQENMTVPVFDFSSVVPGKQGESIMDEHAEPEMEVPPLESPRESREKERHDSQVGPLPLKPFGGEESVKGEVRRLHRGDLFGEESFNEHSRMPCSLAARSEGIVCRAGHDEVCRALRGNCESTPPLSWVMLRNQVKKRLLSIFPFSALYDEMLDTVVEAFKRVEYAPAETIVSIGEEALSFFIVTEGEAVLSRTTHEDGSVAIVQPMERWSNYGTRQFLLGDVADADITAAASGCCILSLSHEAFFSAAGVLCHELQTKMLHQDLNINMQDCIIEGILGKGQFGVVRRVKLECLQEEDLHSEGFALKSMSKKRVLDLEQAAACKLEREILCECCHPLIVRLITTFQDDFSVHLVMETLSGGDLFTAIRDIGTLNEDHVLFYSASIILGIEYIHSRGIVYRDLKPENIMLTAEGFVKIVDFGCCTRKMRSYTFTGTPEYLAPEVILGKGYGKAVDWWSLGVIMYELICGPLPFGESKTDPLAVMKEVLEKELTFPSQVRGDSREDILTALLERMPEQRLGSSTAHWQSEVRSHAFFEDLQWDAILEQSTTPPYVPPSSLAGDDSIRRVDSCSSVSSSESDAGAEYEETELPDDHADLSCFDGF
jgi:cGMP-dependent protein kinase